ncbi:MAG: histidine phosphatase family protein [Actinomycetota bacterium]|nr:histidine phosphatase family protein [Actinomycetota bacterium]
MSRLLLVRHGQTAWNAERRLQGQFDIPLSRSGIEQVIALRGAVHAFRPDRAVTSQLARAVESCVVLGYPHHETDERWQEADLGDWTGRSSAELQATGDGAYRRWRAGDLTPPAGESFDHLMDRVYQAIDELAALDGTTLVVTHGGPIRAACAALVGLGPGHVVPVSPGSLTVIDGLREGPARLSLYNHSAQPSTGEPPD